MDKDLAGVGEVTLLIAVALVTLLPEEVGPIKPDRKDIMVKVDIVFFSFSLVVHSQKMKFMMMCFTMR